MSTRTYDPKKVILTIGPYVMGGFADGAFITVRRDEDAFSKKTGTDGEVTRAKSNNNSGSIEVVLDLASPSNDALNALATLDELSNAGLVPVLLQEIGNASALPIVAAEAGWVKKKPDQAFSKKAEDRTWTIDLGSMDYLPSGIAK
jgi:hypothetical protein